MVETPFVRQRTSDSRIPEMLIGAFRVIASATRRLVLAEWLFRIYLVTKCQGHEASRHIF